MYDVQAQIVIAYPSITYLPSELIEGEWIDIVSVPQLETDSAEYQEAKTVAEKLREFYKNVRVLKSTPGGAREIVRECPFTQSHTREWCGYSECRES